MLGSKIRILTYGFTLTDEQYNALMQTVNDKFNGMEAENHSKNELAGKAIKRYFRKHLDRRPVIDVINV
jgi:gluconate kinase